MGSKIKYIDLFCGMGGLRLALPSDKTKCVFSCDINEHAQDIYELNYKERPYGDITKIKNEEIPEHDLLIGGFPCQAFSVAGLQKGFEDTRGTLFFEVARIIKYHKPKAFLLENVHNLIRHDKGKTLSVILKTLDELGYNVEYRVLSANDFGLPQSRERIAIVGVIKPLVFDFSKIKMKKAENLECFLEEKGEKYIDPLTYTLLPKEIIKKTKKGLIFCGYRNKNMRKNGVSSGGANISRNHRQCNRIYSISGYHPTITSQETSGRYFIEDKYGVRQLTIKECLKLMGFPNNYLLSGSKSKQFERIGNSVCIPVFASVINEILSQIFKINNNV